MYVRIDINLLVGVVDPGRGIFGRVVDRRGGDAIFARLAPTWPESETNVEEAMKDSLRKGRININQINIQAKRKPEHHSNIRTGPLPIHGDRMSQRYRMDCCRMHSLPAQERHSLMYKGEGGGSRQQRTLCSKST